MALVAGCWVLLAFDLWSTCAVVLGFWVLHACTRPPHCSRDGRWSMWDGCSRRLHAACSGKLFCLHSLTISSLFLVGCSVLSCASGALQPICCLIVVSTGWGLLLGASVFAIGFFSCGPWLVPVTSFRELLYGVGFYLVFWVLSLN